MHSMHHYIRAMTQYNISIEFGTDTKLLRLIKMLLRETEKKNIAVSRGKHLSDSERLIPMHFNFALAINTPLRTQKMNRDRNSS